MKGKLSLEEFERRNKRIFLEIGRNLEKLKKKDQQTYKEFMEMAK